MTIHNENELFIKGLSCVRNGAEHAAKVYHELSNHVDHAEAKEALKARAFVSEKVVSTLDECFHMIGAKPVEVKTRLHEVWMEEFREGLSDIESRGAKLLYILGAANHLNHLRMGEYVLLIEAADMMGHRGVGLLLATCLADKIAFTKRIRHLMRKIVEGEVEMKRAA